MKPSAEMEIRAAIKKREEEIDVLRSTLKILVGTGKSSVPQNGRSPARSTRKGSPQLRALKEFVRRNEPVRRKDIIGKSHIPIGTISSNLKESNGFRKDSKKRWYVAESQKGGDSG